MHFRKRSAGCESLNRMRDASPGTECGMRVPERSAGCESRNGVRDVGAGNGVRDAVPGTECGIQAQERNMGCGSGNKGWNELPEQSADAGLGTEYGKRVRTGMDCGFWVPEHSVGSESQVKTNLRESTMSSF
ncbi:hypothetical protein chiPu_0014428 [Chiloscyllium punctatum]|uniref:Uncharacterized protein n=1 Tax=Chiloscyllium punctatum TaxID=137246 RepID=A0A401SZY4_CHIPU|nr:hypothetical protein [Chiloscyllium punctatum]